MKLSTKTGSGETGSLAVFKDKHLPATVNSN